MAGIPRFGHSSDFSNVAYLGSSTNSSAGQDYVVGLIFAGCFLLLFFLTWSIVLVIFKISLTGFLSGEPFINPHLSDPVSLKEKQEMELDGEEYIEDTDWLKRPRRIRIGRHNIVKGCLTFALMQSHISCAQIPPSTTLSQHKCFSYVGFFK
jgi:hypothetical protein